MTEFQFAGVSKVFKTEREEVHALQSVDLEIDGGEFVACIGPSGCGKSTLLNMAAGLMRPTSGTIRYRGRELEGVNTDVGYITQDDNLLPWRTLQKNVELALELRSLKRSERRRLASELLAKVGLADYGDLYPAQASGGMRKRASLARTLVYDPSTLLMDEPFGALDAQLRASMHDQLMRIWEAEQKTVLFITHDLEEAILLADRVVVFSPAPGQIVHIEPIVLPRPRTVMESRSSPAFQKIWQRLWTLLDPLRNRDGGADSSALGMTAQ